MTETQQRKEFEAHFGYEQWNYVGGEYSNPIAQAKWQGWQAGRSSLESENAALVLQLEHTKRERNLVGKSADDYLVQIEAAESENARLREALKQIENGDGDHFCDCAHDVPECCSLVDYFCPHCIAGKALKGPA